MNNSLIVKKSKIHGNGVFAEKAFAKDEIIEVCPVIVLNKNEVIKIDETVLYSCYFNWEKDGAAICLGYGSIYNHSYSPNAIYEPYHLREQMVFKAIRDINHGEEILVNYNGDPTNKELLWFFHNKNYE